MEGYQVLLLVLGIVAFVLVGMYFIVPALVKRGIDVSGVLTGTGNALGTAELVLKGLEGVIARPPGLVLVETIIKYAREGVAAIEQVYKAGMIAGDERKQAAEQAVYDMLAMADIEATEDIKKITEICIEAAVLALPKTHDAEQEGARR